MRSLLLVITVALFALPAEAVQRAFVASYGSDANAATSCGFAAPCRSFAAAVPVVDSGGEVLALDSIGYGMVTINKSITITAAPGAYAGISVSPGGIGVAIAAPGVNVTLRGLNINNQGGNTGVFMINGSRLSIENCVISNFSNAGGAGVFVISTAKVRIVDSLIRDNHNGVYLDAGTTGEIANSKLLGNSAVGLTVQANEASTTTTAAVSDSLVTGSEFGVLSTSAHATGSARVSVIRTTVTHNSLVGLYSSTSAGGSALITVSDSMVMGNAIGLSRGGVGAVLETLGNNTVRLNDTNQFVVPTPVAPM